MLTYNFDNIGNDSMYIHLYKCIKDDILAGKLVKDEKLPSKRNFAKNLGISVITVENAYAQLLAEGYIYSQAKSGYYVSGINTVMRAATGRGELPDIGGRADKKYSIDLVTNHIKPDNFPFSIWAKIMREVLSNKSEELMVTSESGGIRELREAICKHLREFRNMDVKPEQIIVGAGTEYLYNLLIQLLGSERIFAVENPGYKKLSQIYNINNVKYVPVPIDKSGIEVDRLEESGASVAHISPSHHFPTGIVTSVARRYELMAWASGASDRYILEDDYDSELRLEGKPVPTLYSMDFEEHVIYMNTFTKTLTPTIRISYMVLPMSLIASFKEKLYFYSCTVSNFEQYALARFINEGYYEKHINRMRKYYRNVRDRLLTEIGRSRLRDAVVISEKESGLHFLMKLKISASDSELIKKGIENGIYMSCLSQYYFGDAGEDKEHTLIVNYTSLDDEKIHECVNLLENILGGL